jgi:hypothetical protein
MARRGGSPEPLPQEARSALADYIAELEKVYPEGRGKYQLVPWSEYGEGSYLIKVPLPENEEKWLELSDHMAEVGTRILVASDQLFILAEA